FEPRFTVGEVFSAVGYGASDPDPRRAVFGSRSARTDSVVACLDYEGCQHHSADGEFEADGGACTGDSGGPALDESGAVMGVLSRSNENCTAGVYTNVSRFRAFIEGGLVEAAAAAAEADVGAQRRDAGSIPDAAAPTKDG